MNNDMAKDTDHWRSLKPPLSPNPYEIEIYMPPARKPSPL